MVTRRILFLLSAVTLLTSAASGLFANDTGWTGGGGADNNFSNSANWDNGTPSGSGADQLYFGIAAGDTPFNNYNNGTQFQSFFFTSGAGAFNISGNFTNLYGRIENQSTTSQTISLAGITFVGGSSSTANQVNPVNGNLTISSPIFLNFDSSVDVYGANGNTVTFSGAIQNGNTTTGGIRIQQNSVVVLSSASNTFSGGVDLNAGVLSVSAASNLGTGSGTAVRFNGGTLRTTTGITTTRAITVGAGGGTVENVSGTQTLLSGAVTGGTLDKTGTGRVGLRGTADNASLGFTVNQGILALEKTSSSTVHAVGATLTVNSGGTVLLGGSGNDQIFNSAGLTMAGGTFNTGSLSEGTATNGGAGIGALTLTANSTVNFGTETNSILHFAGLGTHTKGGPDLAITNWSGVANLGGSGDRLLFTGTTDQFIAQYDQTDVSFNGLTGYRAVQFGDFYEVTAVPEPSTYAAGILAFAAIGFAQRRRIRSLIARRA